MKAIERRLQRLILGALKTFPAVYINEPRQAGKTTLVRELLAKDFKAEFITFDDVLECVAAIHNPLGYIGDSGTPLIIDEVQMSESMADIWFRNYIQKITLEDPRHIYNLEKAEFMPMLLQALAARAGNLINDANIGREIDFVLERHGKLVALEVKHAENITDKDLSGIKELQADTGDDFCCGIVLCNTPRVLAYGEGIYLVPFSALWQ